MTKTKHSLFMSAIALLLCCSMLIGTTFAWFTDSVTSSNNVIKSGTLDVTLSYLTAKEDPTSETATWKEIVNEENKDGDPIFNYTLWEPGYTMVRHIKIENKGSLALKYIVNFIPKDEQGKIITDLENLKVDGYNLADVIDVYYSDPAKAIADRNSVEGLQYLGTLTEVLSGLADTANGTLVKDDKDIITLALKMKEEAGNEYQDKYIGASFDIQLLATQLNSEEDSFDKNYDVDAEYEKLDTTDTWDGTADFALFGLPRNASETDIENVSLAEDEYIISTAEELVAFAKLVDAGKNFADKTIKLASNIDLYFEDENGEAICFDPIGTYRKKTAFKGTFDGQGYTISNLSQNTWALNNGYSYGDLGLGFFGLVEDAQIKNLKMDGAYLSGESAIVGIVAACAYGDCTFENITVTNSKGADYQYYAGGIVGWASGNHKYINCNVDASTTIAAQWGDFDNSTGGVIGGAGGSATIYMENCDVACRIDAYNDVTSSYQWYAYRRCGMLIGNTGKTTVVDGTTYADAPQLECKNVTVTYEDWANYTYCEFAGKSWPYVRVQEGISNSAYSNPRYGHPTDANGNKVVDDNHVHNEGEDHFILCEFNQLYGGGQGVYGTATHEGVTVIYNNK